MPIIVLNQSLNEPLTQGTSAKEGDGSRSASMLEDGTGVLSFSTLIGGTVW